MPQIPSAMPSPTGEVAYERQQKVANAVSLTVSSVLSVHRLTKTARPTKFGKRVSYGLLAVPAVSALIAHGGDRAMLNLSRPAMEDEVPTWYTPLHAELLVNDQESRTSPVAALVTFDGLDYMVVNQAFLDAPASEQKAKYNATIDKKVTHRAVDATLTTAIMLTSFGHRWVFVGDRERLSGRRAAAYIATSTARSWALKAAKKRMLSAIEPPHYRA